MQMPNNLYTKFYATEDKLQMEKKKQRQKNQRRQMEIPNIDNSIEEYTGKYIKRV